MGDVYLSESLAHLAPVLRCHADLLRLLGIGFAEVRVCRRFPARPAPDDFVLWLGERRGLPALPGWATGGIRSRRAGHFGCVQARTLPDLRLLLSRWDEIEASGGQVYFAGSVAEDERQTGDLRWVIDRLVQCHSYSLLRPVDWGRLERDAGRRLDGAQTPADHLRAWEWLFAQLKDSHTKAIRIEGADVCSRVHCGLQGRFADRHRFVIERVVAGSAADEARLRPGDRIPAVNGCDWPTYLRRESAFWAFSSPPFRRACGPFIPWYQPAGTHLELETSRGRRTLRFGEESFPGFFHWLSPQRPEPVTFDQLGPTRYRLRIVYFPGEEGFVADCRQALLSLPPGAELELDLRGNSGGSGAAMFALAGVFLRRGAPLSRRRGRRVGGGFTRWTLYRNPDDPVYVGPLRVLMDELCASSTEGLLGSLKAAGRAHLVGRRSAGATGNPRLFVSPGGVRFICSSWEETTPASEPIEGRGISTKPWP